MIKRFAPPRYSKQPQSISWYMTASSLNKPQYVGIGRCLKCLKSCHEIRQSWLRWGVMCSVLCKCYHSKESIRVTPDSRGHSISPCPNHLTVYLALNHYQTCFP